MFSSEVIGGENTLVLCMMKKKIYISWDCDVHL